MRMHMLLQDDFNSAGGLGIKQTQQQRMSGYLRFSEQLQSVSSSWSHGPGSLLRQVMVLVCVVCCLETSESISYDVSMQVVLSELSGQVAAWMMKDSAPVQHQLEDVTLPKSSNSFDMLTIQLGANWLAQQAGY